MNSFDTSISEAIAREEGFYVADSRAMRNNNPGNIEFGSFAQKYGAIKGDSRFAKFPTPEVGFTALRDLLLNNYRGLTIKQTFYKYAPPEENDTEQYIENVCKWTGLTEDTVVGEQNV